MLNYNHGQNILRQILSDIDILGSMSLPPRQFNVEHLFTDFMTLAACMINRLPTFDVNQAKYATLK